MAISAVCYGAGDSVFVGSLFVIVCGCSVSSLGFVIQFFVVSSFAFLVLHFISQLVALACVNNYFFHYLLSLPHIAICWTDCGISWSFSLSLCRINCIQKLFTAEPPPPQSIV